jgi:Leucine-rich repeat (LRR) protein
VALLELTAVVEGFVTNKQDLDLSSNLISSLPASVLANSPLSSLSLANNSLTALQPKLFSGLSNLLHLGKLFHFFLSSNRGGIFWICISILFDTTSSAALQIPLCRRILR